MCNGSSHFERRMLVNWEVFVTCAVTGAGDTVGRSEHVPVTPEQIAEAAIDAARAGAAVAHIHVRDPEQGAQRAIPRSRAVVEQIRAADVDVVLNLTAGMGGDLVLGGRGRAAAAERGRDGHGRRRSSASLTSRSCARRNCRPPTAGR